MAERRWAEEDGTATHRPDYYGSELNQGKRRGEMLVGLLVLMVFFFGLGVAVGAWLF